MLVLVNKNYIAYDIYKHDMFMHTQAKFNKKIDAFLNDDFVKIFACLYRCEIKGIMEFSETYDRYTFIRYKCGLAKHSNFKF